MGLVASMNTKSGLRRVFRSLKCGTVPPGRIRELTVGRGRELNLITEQLDVVSNGTSQHVFMEGSYGRGKSHMLKAVENLALDRGFAVSWVTLDGQNHPCNHPTRYLHSFLENLRVPNYAVRGLAVLVRAWLAGPEAAPVITWARQSDSWLRYAIAECHRRLTVAADVPFLDSWIECRDLALKNGKSWFELVGQRMGDIAGLIRAAGFKGVVYLFDEVESVATLLWGVRQRYLSYAFLSLLLDHRRHPHCFFAFAATPDFGLKVRLDRACADHYSAEYPSACRFVQAWHESRVSLVKLGPLRTSDVVNLCKRLRDYHGRGFEWRSEARISDGFIERFVLRGDGRSMDVRAMVKEFVHVLEIAEQYPRLEIERVFDLRQTRAAL